MSAANSTAAVPPGGSDEADCNVDRNRALISGAIDAVAAQLWDLNKAIHSHPELAYEEVLAHDTLTAFLEARGFTVKRHTYGLKTSFEAEVGTGGSGRLIVFCAEYDALPGIGHACGHNLIATSSVAAFVGLATAVQQLGLPGRVRILGTPAEEGAGGKVKLLEAGAFKDDVAAAIMAHPMSGRQFDGGHSGLAGLRMIASHKLRVEYRGKNAHAGAEPWEGVNALDAAVLAYNNVSVLRQQIRPNERIHGVIEVGGTVPNVITEYSRMNWYVRAPTLKRADMLLKRVMACFEAAAAATGCEVGYIHAPTYANLRANAALCRQYVDEMAGLGEKIVLDREVPSTASTDMGNVSHAVPSFHGVFGIPTPENVSIHHPSFTEAAGKEEAHAMAVTCGKGMAMLGLRVLEDEKLASEAMKEFLVAVE